jgi:hypothetical protein
MPNQPSKGHCYICGKEFGKQVIKNHIAKTHDEEKAAQKCLLLKVEGAYDKNYWLYLDMPVQSKLIELDDFLRKIWLECCGHLSAFRITSREIPMNTTIGKVHTLVNEHPIEYEYDFGSTTYLLVTIIGEISRPKQKDAIRLLARNNPPVFTCADCEQEAVYMHPFSECEEDAFFCEDCGNEHKEAEMLMPVTNSPRMGVCGYTGEMDTYAFEPNV